MATVRATCFLRPPEPDDLDRLQDWLADPMVHQWFDFGMGRQHPSRLSLHAMACSDRHCMRVFGEPAQAIPLGFVALSDVDHPFGTASFWVVRDHRRHAYAGITVDASRALLRHGFNGLGRQSVNAWVVQGNERSLRLLEQLGFRRYGTQRACHLIEGVSRDRIHLELLSDEWSASDSPRPCSPAEASGMEADS